MSAEISRVGDVLADKYRLEELLGSGGMGHVYRALNVEIERSVAIKVLRSEHATNPTIVDRFLREARAANLVRHPNVVDVVDVGRDSDGSPFIVQELLKGEDLAQFSARHGGKLSLGDIEEYLLPVIDAVAEAHAKGVVHRDLKPENVFLADQGRQRVPKLLDFGISKVRSSNIKQTEIGVMMGTPAYMAPEQIQGARDADPRADVWALGIMLYELIAGQLPFEAEDAPSLFYAVATQDVPPLSKVAPVPTTVSTIVERCLRRSPADRYPTALELARDLRGFFEDSEFEATKTQNGPVTPMSGELELGLPDLTVPELAVPERAPASPRSAKVIVSTPVTVPPSSRREPSPSSRREASIEPLAGVMLSGPSSAPRRPPPVVRPNDVPRYHAAASGQDMGIVLALAVVGITTIGVIAGLASVASRPEGWPLVAYVTKPTATANLVIHGGLGLVGFAFGARSAADAVKKWQGAGGRGAAVVGAMIAGALFFAGLQFARAAW